MILTRKLPVLSEGGFYSLNITEQVRDVVKESGIREGVAFIFYQHTTGSVLLIEHETGILVDLENMLEDILPRAGDYTHHIRGYDANGAAHIRSALLGTSVHIPVLGGDLQLGTYQEVLMVDMDTARKERTILVQVMGD